MKKITTRIIRWALGEQLKTILYYVFILIHLYHIICVGGGDPEICEMWPNPPPPFFYNLKHIIYYHRTRCGG